MIDDSTQTDSCICQDAHVSRHTVPVIVDDTGHLICQECGEIVIRHAVKIRKKSKPLKKESISDGVHHGHRGALI